MWPWPADALEGLDDEHACTAAGARATRHSRRIRFGVVAAIDGVAGWIDGLHAQQRPRLGDVGLPLAVGEQAVMADAMQALRQHVDEEASG